MKPLGEMSAAEYREHDREFALELARNLRSTRERIGWTQKRLARETGYPPSMICNLEKGRRRVWIRQLVRMTVALGVAPWSVLPRKKRAILSSPVDNSSTSLRPCSRHHRELRRDPPKAH
jgi:transcriptional regulator with XRE-family HTH domain